MLWLPKDGGRNVDTLIAQTRLRRQPGVAVRSGASWLSLVAATTKGLGQLGRVRVKIRTAAPMAGTTFRLVVHSYAASALLNEEPPSAALTPIASLQRAVTHEELCAGLELDLVHVGRSMPVPDNFLVFAWVEPGQPDFAYDAALARPSVGALKGRALSHPQRQDCRVAEVLLTAA